MAYAPCNVVYVDRAAPKDCSFQKDIGVKPQTAVGSDLVAGPPTSSTSEDRRHSTLERPTLVSRNSKCLDTNIQTLLERFGEVNLCTSGSSCLAKLSEINRISFKNTIPTLVLIDIPYEEQLTNHAPPPRTRSPSPNPSLLFDGAQDKAYVSDAYGFELLQQIASGVRYNTLSQLVVPVALVAIPAAEDTHISGNKGASSNGNLDLDKSRSLLSPSTDSQSTLAIPLEVQTKKYLDVGAIDVLTSPLVQERLASLGIHAYQAYKDASKSTAFIDEAKRGRKRSWIGFEDQPYQYLREIMVSRLMDDICRPHVEDELQEPLHEVGVPVSPSRKEKIAMAIGTWNFDAHAFSDDELLYGAVLMLQHALTMPELEEWRISAEQLTTFLVVSRQAYNVFVPYHNFRHVIDVLQATFHFLLGIGRLPRYFTRSGVPVPTSPSSELIRPFEALMLLITAIGHDVGHPGVNNGFLVNLGAPLAQLYNDNSVLESFHCAAYSQILRRHWPSIFENRDMRKLLISSILATDMSLHSEYMKKLGRVLQLQSEEQEAEKTHNAEGDVVAERALICALLIKCADISNVARSFNIATKWTDSLNEEFSRQALMEQELEIKSTLFAKPTKDLILLGEGQLGFMNYTAIPLFEGVVKLMPSLNYCVKELHQNTQTWAARISEEKVRRQSTPVLEETHAPRAMSLAAPSGASNQDPGSATKYSYDANNILKMNYSDEKSSFIPDESAGLGNYHPLPGMSQNEIFSAGTSPGSYGISMSNPRQLQFNIPVNSPFALPFRPKSPEKSQQLDSVGSSPSSDPLHTIEASASYGVNSTESSTSPGGTEFAGIPETDPMEEAISQDDKRKSSATQETTPSVAGDWNSQATSTTAGNQPFSPSTQGSSVVTRDSNGDRGLTPTASKTASANSQATSSTPSPGQVSNDHALVDENKSLSPPVRTLKKKKSRLRNGIDTIRRKLSPIKSRKSADEPAPFSSINDELSV